MRNQQQDSHTHLASPSKVRKALVDSRLMSPDERLSLIYPGSGWDFSSFWPNIDPDDVVMVDPAPVTLEGQGLDEWKTQLVSQLGLPNNLEFEDLTFDAEMSEIRPKALGEWKKIDVIDYEIVGSIRPGFYCEFILKARKRTLTFIATRIEDLKFIGQLKLDEKLTYFSGLPKPLHIVYEHKSNVSYELLSSSIERRGCLVWGLPDDKQTFEMLLE